MFPSPSINPILTKIPPSMNSIITISKNISNHFLKNENIFLIKEVIINHPHQKNSVLFWRKQMSLIDEGGNKKNTTPI
jgi:hypothetical protein